MAVDYKENPTAEKPNATITVDNGDLQAIKDVMATYRFVDQQAMLRYALVALLSSDDNKLFIKKDGNIVAMNVAESLLKKRR